MKLNVYCPRNNPTSKAFLVFNALKAGWKDGVEFIYNYRETDGPSIFWGFVGNNMQLVQRHMRLGHPWYFTDMSYLSRWQRPNPTAKHYWRITEQGLHQTTVKDVPGDRWKEHNIELKEWNTKGDHILICPSSPTINRFYNESKWTTDIVEQLKKYTDRPIIIREKPRPGNKWEQIPFYDQAKNAHAIVTTVSVAGIEAAINGVPVFCSQYSAALPISLTDISKIETPIYPDREKWLHSLSYSQFTPQEIESGLAYDILKGI